MRLQRFGAERRPGWIALEALLARRSLGADETRELGTRYREAAADLALARRAFPAEPVTPALEALVGRARQAVYAEAGPTRSPLGFYATGLWRAIAGLGPFLLVSAVLFLGTIGLGVLWGASDPDAARGWCRAGSSTPPTRRGG